MEMAQEAAFRDTNRPIVIYANDASIEETPEPLSAPLRTFVRFDNRFFKQEAVEEGPREKKRQPIEPPTSPSKRQQRSNSIDSMATNKASVDEQSDRDMSDAPLVVEKFVVDEVNSDALVEADGEGQCGGSASEAPRDFQETEKGGSLGTEMVQLAISRLGKKTPANLIGQDGDESRVGLEAAISDMEGETGGKCNSSVRQCQQRPLNKDLSSGEVNLVADWEYPEGRCVDPPGSTRTS